MTTADVGALIRLVRLPSVVTVPGDVLVGAAWGPDGDTSVARRGALALSSSLAYLSGMALNDWADRELDARERPGRPIPAGEVDARHALMLAIGLSAGALAVSAGARGGRSLAGSVPLIATVWAYDLKAKGTTAGPWTMALARSLDVLVGAPGAARRAAPAAGLVGAHTLLVTLVSRSEADGASAGLAAGAFAGVLGTTSASIWLIGRGGATRSGHRRPAMACVALYALTMTRAVVSVARSRDAGSVQRLVGSGVFANMPLQAALLAHRGRIQAAASVLAAWPVAKRAARRVAVS
jgi:hypothetical protein